MGFTVCPAAVVAAQVKSAWELLSEPTLYDIWWDARTERIVLEGKASMSARLHTNPAIHPQLTTSPLN